MELTQEEKEYIVEWCFDILGCNFDGGGGVTVENFESIDNNRFSTLKNENVKILRSIARKMIDSGMKMEYIRHL